jgi:hypothetical protein
MVEIYSSWGGRLDILPAMTQLPAPFTDGARLIRPAFGAHAGGLYVTNAAIAGLLASPFQVLVVGQAKVHALSSAQLRTPTAGERRSSR